MCKSHERFTVVITLNGSCNLEIATCACHAYAVMSGETCLPNKHLKVLDTDGKHLTKSELRRLCDVEEAD